MQAPCQLKFEGRCGFGDDFEKSNLILSNYMIRLSDEMLIKIGDKTFLIAFSLHVTILFNLNGLNC